MPPMLRIYGRPEEHVMIEGDNGIAVDLPARPYVRVEICSRSMLAQDKKAVSVEFRAVQEEPRWLVTLANSSALPWPMTVENENEDSVTVVVGLDDGEIKVFGRLSEEEPEALLMSVSADNVIEMPAFVRCEPRAVPEGR